MSRASITSALSFKARLLRAELYRAWVLGGVWVVMLVLTVLRRLLADTVMQNTTIFATTCLVLLVALAYQGLSIADTVRRLRKGLELPAWRLNLGATIDLALPIAAMAMLQYHAPEGHEEALEAPALLVLAVVIVLSILRLRPRVSALSGLAGGLSHASLVVIAILSDHLDRHHWPELFTYSTLLVLCGVVASLISTQVRAYVREAVDEAVAGEQRQRALEAMEHDLSIAREIQQGLMPSAAPNIAGFQLAGMNRPAQETGGDYYDWQTLPDGRLIVAIADVTGHGIGPALVMAVCRAYARASARADMDSAALLSRVNALLYDDLSSCGRFITMVIAILSPDGTIELVSAGHGPTLLYRAAAKQVEWFGGDGFPLGIDATENYGPHRLLKLEPGDALLLLTDGFMEWPRAGDGEQFGLERLKEAFAEGAPAAPQAILSHLDARVSAFAAGAPQLDDTTAVVIKRAER